MIAQYLILPLLGAVYASAWWAFALFVHKVDSPILIPLVIVGLAYLCFIGICTAYDMDNN